MDWADVDAAAAHAARHMSVYGRSDYLADQLRHTVYLIAELPDGGLSATQGIRSARDAGEHFRAMREHFRAAGITTPYAL